MTDIVERLRLMASGEEGYANSVMDVYATLPEFQFYRDCASAATLIEKQRAVIASLSGAASLSAMYLKTGFIECDRCGHEVETKNTDAAYTLREALTAARTLEDK